MGDMLRFRLRTVSILVVDQNGREDHNVTIDADLSESGRSGNFISSNTEFE